MFDVFKSLQAGDAASILDAVRRRHEQVQEQPADTPEPQGHEIQEQGARNLEEEAGAEKGAEEGGDVAAATGSD
jgi:hypothetical protein